MIDEAHLPFHQLIQKMMDFAGEIDDEQVGVRSHIYECTIDTPVELSIGVTDDGQVQIGSAPPLYYVETSILPSFHQVRFTAVRNNTEQVEKEEDDGAE